METEFLTAAFEYVDGLGILPVYFPNVHQDQPEDSYIKAAVFSTPPERLGLCDGASRHLWILQLSVYVRDGVGQIIPAQYADLLRASFPFKTVITNGGYSFHTETQGTINSPVNTTEGWYFIPLQFQFITSN